MPKMRNPFRRQDRESVTQQLLSEWQDHLSTGNVDDVRRTAVGEIVAREYEAALAESTCNYAGLDAEARARIGRSLATTGNSVWLITVGAEDVTIAEAATWDIAGDTDNPNQWMYQLTMPRPSGDHSEIVSGASVLHFRYSTDPRAPWRGISPLTRMVESSRALGGSEARVADELEAIVNFPLPVPQQTTGANTDALKKLAQGLQTQRGKTLVVTSMSSGWGEGMSGRVAREWEPRRTGGNPPATIQGLRHDLLRSALAAAGIPPPMVGMGISDLATPAHWRQSWLDTTVEPMLLRIANEATAKLNTDVTFELPQVRDLELMRARAQQAQAAAN